MPRRSILLFAAACAVIAAALAIVTVVVVNGRGTGDPAGVVVDSGQPDVGGPFQLVDQNGRTVDQSLLDGKWTLVFFGFTYCPDFCPTTLTAIEAARRELGADARNLQTVFISVDPARDTPEALKAYLDVEGFPPGVIGLTGTEAQVEAAADAYRAFYQKVGDGEAYTMNHSLTIYLMGPDGRFRTALGHDLGPQRSAALIRQAMARG